MTCVYKVVITNLSLVIIITISLFHKSRCKIIDTNHYQYMLNFQDCYLMLHKYYSYQSCYRVLPQALSKHCNPTFVTSRHLYRSLTSSLISPSFVDLSLSWDKGYKYLLWVLLTSIVTNNFNCFLLFSSGALAYYFHEGEVQSGRFRQEKNIFANDTTDLSQSMPVTITAYFIIG